MLIAGWEILNILLALQWHSPVFLSAAAKRYPLNKTIAQAAKLGAK